MRTMPGHGDWLFAEEQDHAADWAALASMPDDAVVCMPGDFADVPDLPGATYAPDIPGLRRVISEFVNRNFGWDEYAFLSDIPHEQEHAAAAAVLGCTSRFYLRFAPLQDGDRGACLGHSWVARSPMTKLAAASIAAAPSILSGGDMADLRRMGYRDVDDVAGRIRRFNQTARFPLTVPGSARPA